MENIFVGSQNVWTSAYYGGVVSYPQTAETARLIPKSCQTAAPADTSEIHCRQVEPTHKWGLKRWRAIRAPGRRYVSLRSMCAVRDGGERQDIGVKGELFYFSKPQSTDAEGRVSPFLK